MAEDDTKNEDEEKGKEAKSKGGSKKLLIIGLLVGLLIGGGGAAGFFLMKPSDDAGQEHVEEIVEEEQIAPELPDYQYARMDKLQLPIIYKGRVLNYVVMDVSMEVIGNIDKMVLVKSVLVIRDELIRHFSENSVGREDNPRTVDYDSLSEKIKKTANDTVHQDMVKRVMISESRIF